MQRKVLFVVFIVFLLLHKTYALETFLFIKYEKNSISNAKKGLSHFKYTIKQLVNGNIKSISIVHIGDSHVQADIFTANIRKNLQKIYGNAGYGIVFPYEIAKTNGAGAYDFSFSGKWGFSRITNVEIPESMGLCGYTIKCNAPASKLNFKLHSTAVNDFSFNKIDFLYKRSNLAYNFVFIEKDKKFLGITNSIDQFSNPYCFTLKLKKQISEFSVYAANPNLIRKPTDIYGFVLSNSNSGLLYHSIGVNGAKFYDYNLKGKELFEQTKLLKPDLLIVGLGSNEAFYTSFSSVDFKNSVNEFINNIKIHNPNTDILFIIPPDINTEINYINFVHPMLISICKEKNVAYWDLYEVMGGKDSMDKWIQNDLGNQDNIHFTVEGYTLMANLFTQALLKYLQHD